MSKISISTPIEIKYREYRTRVNNLIDKHNIKNVAPKDFEEFKKTFKNIKDATRPERWSAETILNRIVKYTVQASYHKQAQKLVPYLMREKGMNKKEAYNYARYNPKAFDIIRDIYEKYKAGTLKENIDGIDVKSWKEIRQTYIASP